MAVDFHAPSATVLSPSILAHVVLRTSPETFAALVSYYKTFLGAHATYENPAIAFLTYDAEHHRIAIAAVPGSTPRVPSSVGMEHIAFAYTSLSELLLAYRQRKVRGITPLWSVNHGPTTSIYYVDADGNKIETQTDNFATNEEANAFMDSPFFAENPVGVDVDPEELIRKIEEGVNERSLLVRKEMGPRGFDTVPGI